MGLMSSETLIIEFVAAIPTDDGYTVVHDTMLMPTKYASIDNIVARVKSKLLEEGHPDKVDTLVGVMSIDAFDNGPQIAAPS